VNYPERPDFQDDSDGLQVLMTRESGALGSIFLQIERRDWLRFSAFGSLAGDDSMRPKERRDWGDRTIFSGRGSTRPRI
jgi:hypothetical protein